MKAKPFSFTLLTIFIYKDVGTAQAVFSAKLLLWKGIAKKAAKKT